MVKLEAPGDAYGPGGVCETPDRLPEIPQDVPHGPGTTDHGLQVLRPSGCLLPRRNAWKPEFENFRRQFGILYWGAYAKKPDGTDDANFYVLYNMHWEPHMFGLPHLPKGAKWHVICSTADPDVEDLPSDGTGEVLKNQMMLAVPPRGIMILESVADPDAGKETKKGKSGSKKEKNEKTDLVEKSCEKEEKSTPENGKEL